VGKAISGSATYTNHGTGLPAYLLASGAGTAAGAVGPVYTAQSALIPESLVVVSKGSDGGFPVP